MGVAFLSSILSESRITQRTRKTRKGLLSISGVLSQDRVILAKTLFFRVLCVLCVIRDSDGYFCQNRGKREERGRGFGRVPEFV